VDVRGPLSEHPTTRAAPQARPSSAAGPSFWPRQERNNHISFRYPSLGRSPHAASIGGKRSLTSGTVEQLRSASKRARLAPHRRAPAAFRRDNLPSSTGNPRSRPSASLRTELRRPRRRVASWESNGSSRRAAHRSGAIDAEASCSTCAVVLRISIRMKRTPLSSLFYPLSLPPHGTLTHHIFPSTRTATRVAEFR